MDQPVTKRELQASFDSFLAVLMERLDKRFEQVDKRFEQVDKRFEQVDKRFEQVDKRFEQLRTEIVKDVGVDVARYTKSVGEDVFRSIALVDDRYNGLPERVAKLEANTPANDLQERVARLEAVVFKPAPQRRRRAR